MGAVASQYSARVYHPGSTGATYTGLPAESNHFDPLDELQRDHVHFVAAYDGTDIVGCGALKLFADYGEIKRMFVSRGARRRGIGQQIIAALEHHARINNIMLIRLETGRRQEAARQLYRQAGYRQTGPFGDYQEDPHSIFMEKGLEPLA